MLNLQDMTAGETGEDVVVEAMISDGSICELLPRRFKAASVYSTPAGGSRNTSAHEMQVHNNNKNT